MPTFETLKAMANAAREADEVPEAIRLYTELVGIRPNWTEGWWYLGTLYYEKDQYTDGARAFQRFVTLEPKGGSKKPTNKPFLLAYLHTAPPNHP